MNAACCNEEPAITKKVCSLKKIADFSFILQYN